MSIRSLVSRLGVPSWLGIVLVLLVGGILSITGHLSWHVYEHDAAILLGLLGIGHGIDTYSRP